MNRKATVIDEARETDALVARIANARGDGRIVEDVGCFGIAPREKRIDERLRALPRIASFFFRGESTSVRSIRKNMPTRSSAVCARFGSDVIALKKYRRQCAQQLTSTTSLVS